MRKAIVTAGAFLALIAMVPASSFAARRGHRSSAASGAGVAAMVEGRVISASGRTFEIMTPAMGVYCPPKVMCPLVLRAPVDYEVLASGARIYGNYIGELPASAVTVGSTIVVYGSLLRQPLTSLGPPVHPPAITYGVISASGIFVLAAGSSATSGCQGSSCASPVIQPLTGGAGR